MRSEELIIWSTMLGAILTLTALGLVDLMKSRSVAALRGLAFIVLTGSSSLLMSGLVEYLLRDWSPTAMLVLKVSLGPLSGALALNYLGMWLHIVPRDRLVHHTVLWGTLGSTMGAVVLAGLALNWPAQDAAQLITVAAAINIVAVVLAELAATRGAVLGDPLARWMVVACLFLATMVAGLYGHALQWVDMGLGGLAMTAFSTIAYFLCVMLLTMQRNQNNRRLSKLAGFSEGADSATGLPKGSVLLSKVDDAFWRSARMQRNCTVICLHLRNLYELGEVAGHSVDQQILSTMAARMRRAVGFRNVVGLYHPRCFMVVISAVRQPELVQRLESQLRYLMKKPMFVVGVDRSSHTFTPRFGIGMVTVNANSADPTAVLDQAERAALADGEPAPTP